MAYVLACPSWVIPGDIAQNARFLAGKKETGIREIGLCFFESAACLAYGDAELPRDLRGLGFSWHAHLPFDLFAHGPDNAAGTALTLMDKIAFLDARRAVLHPPARGRDLERFTRVWEKAGRDPADILLENTRKAPLKRVLALAAKTGCGLCPDTGHAFAALRAGTSGVSDLARDLERAAARARVLHMNAPAPAGCALEKHFPLTALDPAERALARRALMARPPECALMLELFSWTDILLSLPVLDGLLPDKPPPDGLLKDAEKDR